jgi:hypothetical protein
MMVSFIRGRNQRKLPTCRKSLTNFITLCCIEYTSPWTGFELTTLVVIGTDCIDSSKSNYHTIMATSAPFCYNVNQISECAVNPTKSSMIRSQPVDKSFFLNQFYWKWLLFRKGVHQVESVKLGHMPFLTSHISEMVKTTAIQIWPRYSLYSACV